MAPNTMVVIETEHVNNGQVQSYLLKVQYFAMFGILVMGWVLYNMVYEDHKFIESIENRFYRLGNHGTEILTYGSKVSLLSNVVIFEANFCTALIWC